MSRRRVAVRVARRNEVSDGVVGVRRRVPERIGRREQAAGRVVRERRSEVVRVRADDVSSRLDGARERSRSRRTRSSHRRGERAGAVRVGTRRRDEPVGGVVCERGGPSERVGLRALFPTSSYAYVVTGAGSGPAPSGSGRVSEMRRFAASYANVVVRPLASVDVSSLPASSYVCVVTAPSGSRSVSTCPAALYVQRHVKSAGFAPETFPFGSTRVSTRPASS